MKEQKYKTEIDSLSQKLENLQINQLNNNKNESIIQNQKENYSTT